MPNKFQTALQINALLRLSAQNLNISDSEKMQIADLYPAWESGKHYAVGVIVKHGMNADGESQLYNVLQEHTSADEWKPNAAPSIYTKIGFNQFGVRIWSQPLTYDDAYDIGDEAEHNGEIWIVEQGNATGASGARNTYEPGVWGWIKKND
ncbi:hypothetical protein FACS1894105_14580 [Clostridia bacterium]|nr:hypothetical protein FACS1894105_14580 [Clostridia bacterium]